MTGLLLALGCALTLCGPQTSPSTTRSANPNSRSRSSTAPAQRPTITKTIARDPPAAVLVIRLPSLGSISYQCRRSPRGIAATFTAARMSATDQVSVSEGGRPITHSIVQPADPQAPAPHALTTPFGHYHQLDWLIRQNTEPQLLVARVRLNFVLKTVPYRNAAYPICYVSHWSADVKAKSNARLQSP